MSQIIQNQINKFLAEADLAIKLGNFNDAKKNYLKLLQYVPDHPSILEAIGNICLQLKNFDDAYKFYKKSLTILPNKPEIFFNLAVAFKEQKQFKNALEFYQKAIDNKIDYYQAYFNKANLLRDLELYHEAIDNYKKANQINPYFIDIYINWANTLKDLEKFNDALLVIETALKFDANNVSTLYNYGIFLKELGRKDEALASFNRAIDLNPNYYEAYNGKGNVLSEMNSFDDALASFNRAIDLNPNFYEAYNSMGNILKELHSYEEALASFNRAIALNPKHFLSLTNKAILLLELKQFEVAWDIYKFRFFIKSNQIDILNQLSRPNLFDIEKQKVLVIGEQGLGDQIFYSSILGELSKKASQVILLLDPRLKNIYEKSFPKILFLSKKEELKELEYDGYIPIANLGGLFRRSQLNFPNFTEGYLKSDNHLKNKFKSDLKVDSRLLCGLSWSSNNKKTGAFKSINLNKLLPILKLKNITFVNLQYGDVDNEIYSLKSKQNIEINCIKELDLFNDINGLFSLVDCCDFVITTCNVTAHVAGSLGKLTYLLVPYGRGKIWYWHNGLGKNLWYPTIQMYSQDSQGNWDSAINKIIQSILEEGLRG